MRQAGVLAAAGLIALEKMPARLGEDHENARVLADHLANISLLDINPSAVCTNIVIAGIARTGFDSPQISEKLKNKGVLVGTVDASTIRMLTHFDVSRPQIEETVRVFSHLLQQRG